MPVLNAAAIATILGYTPADADDIPTVPTSLAELDSTAATKLAGIEDGAEVNNISDADATALTGAGQTALHKHAMPYGTTEPAGLTTGDAWVDTSGA